MIEIDGRLSANAGNAISAYGGGGSGGSIWVYCRVFRGMGTIASNGGNQFSGGGGGKIQALKLS
jgi:ABC-type histidine transport system ATPase subunit